MHHRSRCLWQLTSFSLMVCLFSATGCGSAPSVAPVSGCITLNGAPLADAFVVFQPLLGEPGDLSQGKTDNEGNYTLSMMDGRQGANVGRHQVSITTIGPDAMTDERSALPKDKVPKKYRENPLEFDVPQEGSQTANFDLTR